MNAMTILHVSLLIYKPLCIAIRYSAVRIAISSEPVDWTELSDVDNDQNNNWSDKWVLVLCKRSLATFVRE